MPDQISSMRTVRLVLHIPHQEGGRTYFSVHTISTVKGVPRAAVILDGVVAPLSTRPTTQEILEAFDAAIQQGIVTSRSE